jgi:hypothetical protein
MDIPSVDSGIFQRRHAVQFYGSDDSLITTVAGFLSEGLIAGQPAVILATAPHRDAIVAQLVACFIDVEKALHQGDLVVLDAVETLGLFMIGDSPDATAFDTHVGRVFEQVLEGRPATILRAYGEMVDVLWKQGRTEAAIELELLWNKLAARFGFALLCGYSMGNFYKQAALFQEVCRQHTHVLNSDTNVVVLDRTRESA